MASNSGWLGLGTDRLHWLIGRLATLTGNFVIARLPNQCRLQVQPQESVQDQKAH